MIQIVLLLKRKSGLTKEQFRHHYETSHVPMAIKHLGHLFLDYRRNYTIGQSAHGGTAATGSTADTDHDVVTVITLPDRAALAEFGRIAQAPEVFNEFIEDEERFLDRSSKIVYHCEQTSTPLGGAARVARSE